MLEQMGIKSEMIIRFLLILLRISIVFLVLPVFGSKSLPAQFKIGLIVAISLLITPFVQVRTGTQDIVALVIREVLF